MAVRTLGDGPPIVLLHGLAASGSIWGAGFDHLAAQHQLVVPDLLGFGASPKPPGEYGPDEHVAAVLSCLDDINATRPAIVVGHSLGALIAVHLAAQHPDRVAALVCFAPPLYRDEAEARRYIRGLGWMPRASTLDTTLAQRTCQWVCEHRRLAASLAVLTHPGLPPRVARDGVQHTWPSYSGSLRHVLLAATSRRELTRVTTPAHLVTGSRDRIAPPDLIEGLAHTGRIDVDIWNGADHELPLTAPDRCIETITRVAAGVETMT